MQLGATLKDVFGGQPGWLKNVPENQIFDFVEGRTEGPAGTFVRSAGSRHWTYAPQVVPVSVVLA